MSENYFYFASEEMCIGDLGYISKSDNSFDIEVYDLANEENLLKALNLLYYVGNHRTSGKDRFEFFCGYLACFSSKDVDLKHYKLKSNPVVRVLVNDKDMKNKVWSVREKEN